MKIKTKEDIRTTERYYLWLYTDESFKVRSSLLYDYLDYTTVKEWMNKQIELNPNYKGRIRIEKKTIIESLIEEV